MYKRHTNFAMEAIENPFNGNPRFGNQVTCTIGSDPDTAAAINQMGATHEDCLVGDIVEDQARKLVTTPAYMLAQSISEAAGGIYKLVDRIIEMTQHDD